MKLLTLIILSLVIISCSESTEEYLVSQWGIQEMSFKGEAIEETFLSNLFILEENNICEVPIILNDDDILKDNRIGKWSFDVANNLLTIESQNPYLDGVFKICFEKNLEYKRIMLIMESKDVFVKASKGITQYRGSGGKLPIECK